ncbi:MULTISPECIES: Holliday junction resolvase RecU [unclassified Neomoorella]|uniref:Holliday junction resolvase RecU n=1 Tax=unclassified Neomoorella TaxID=2676739 RepID=UPI00114113CF|nr:MULTISPECIES: Holliday junction resolvase RecU [unclassified Moorella (in: firmicutes)]
MKAIRAYRNTAHRGRALEDLVELSNERYRQAGVAVIHRVPAAWLPIRDGRGRIVSAKIEKKAAVDFIGHVLVPGGRALPVAFEAKEVSKGRRWPLSRLEEHQYQYLADCARTGAAAFVLVAFWELGRFFILPFSILAIKEAGRRNGGPASVRAEEQGLVEISFPDYLKAVVESPEIFISTDRQDG